MPMKNGHKLGSVLKSLLKERSLSMRKLSALTGIDTATISRIANGKQVARADHLQKFVEHLQIPMRQLLEASGFDLGQSEAHSDMFTSIEEIQEILSSSNIIDEKYTTQKVEQQLAHYERYAQTEEGQRIIQTEFEAKILQVDGMGPFIEHLKQMHQRYSQDDISENEREILGSVLLYFIMSTDSIPDYVFPIGYLDDAIAVKLTLHRLQEDEHRNR